MRRTVLLALMLVTPLLTGCLGLGGDDGGGEDGLQTESRAQVSSDTGGVEGVVTDSAVQAVQGATVKIQELSESTETKSDGSFAFSNLQPGTYTLAISKEGFIGTEKTVTVSANDVATVEVVLAREPTVSPYTQQFQFQGFLECSVATPAVLVAVCSIPPVLINQIPGADGDNATNDRFLFTHPLEENPWQMVTEMQWQPNQPLARDLSIVVEPEGLSNDGKTEYGDAEGESPLFVRTDRERFVEVVQNTTAVCNEQKDPEGQLSAGRDAYCNRNPIEDGGRVQIRVFVSNAEVTTAQGVPVGAGAAIQQDFTVFQTVFYNTPACEEFSIVEDNQCEQQDQPPATDPYNAIDDGNESSEGGGNRTR